MHSLPAELIERILSYLVPADTMDFTLLWGLRVLSRGLRDAVESTLFSCLRSNSVNSHVLVEFSSHMAEEYAYKYPSEHTDLRMRVPLAASIPVNNHENNECKILKLSLHDFDKQSGVLEFRPAGPPLESKIPMLIYSRYKDEFAAHNDRESQLTCLTGVSQHQPASNSSTSAVFCLDEHANQQGTITFSRVGLETVRFVSVFMHGWLINAQNQKKKRETNRMNPYHRRIYRLDLSDAPGLHYMGDTDMILQYQLDRFDEKITREVPTPGGNGTKRAIVAHDVHFHVSLKRLLVPFSWLLNGYYISNGPAIRQIFPKAFSQLERKSVTHQDRHIVPQSLCVKSESSSDSIARINRRSELILHYLQRHFVGNLSTEKIPSDGEVHALVEELRQHGGLPDRRSIVEQMLLACGLSDLLNTKMDMILVEPYWTSVILVDFILARVGTLTLTSSTTRSNVYLASWNGISTYVIRKEDYSLVNKEVVLLVNRLKEQLIG